MTVSAKICGLSTPGTLDAAVTGGASHVGFVFFAKSPRNLGIEQAAALVRQVPDHIVKVGLFVDADAGFIAEAQHQLKLNVFQLHGNESPAFAARLAHEHKVDIWKAIPVRNRADLDAGRAYHGAVTRLLYDAKPPTGAELPGGNGLRFDWKLLVGHAHPLPWGLSGGLDAINVAEAVRVTGASLVDVSSGVERAPGVKDVDKIAAFLHAVAAL